MALGACAVWISVVCICHGAPMKEDGTFTITARNPGAEMQDSTTPTSLPLGCQSRLSFKIEQCLQRFESRFLVYSDEDSTEELQNAMEKMLCREYEQSLQCLHFALQDCPPTDFHLQMMGARLGHVRDLMEDICTRMHNMESSTKTSTSTTTEKTTTSSTPLPTTSTSSVASSTTVPTFYEVKIVDNSKDTGPVDYKQKLGYEESNDIAGFKAKLLQKDKLMKPAQANEVLDKSELSKDIKSKMNDIFNVPEMNAQTSDCHGPNAESNPLCWDMYFNAGSHTSLNLWWLSLTVILTTICATTRT